MSMSNLSQVDYFLIAIPLLSTLLGFIYLTGQRKKLYRLSQEAKEQKSTYEAKQKELGLLEQKIHSDFEKHRNALQADYNQKVREVKKREEKALSMMESAKITADTADKKVKAYEKELRKTRARISKLKAKNSPPRAQV